MFPLSPRRSLRLLAVVAVSVVGLAIVSPAYAEWVGNAAVSSSTAVPDGVGAPTLILLESVHAPGKVAQIDDPNAQVSSAPGATDRAAAAIETMKTGNAASLKGQALRFYPVSGANNTYVIADQQDRVLTRSRNDQSTFRYLQLADLAASATDPYAQWEARDAGDGTVNLVNVQSDPSAQPAALDLYNWKTADGSEIQTYTLNAGAAVQKWRMRTLEATVAVPTAIVPTGAVPPMPTNLVGRYSWGGSFPLTSITWQMPDPSVWNTGGELDVTGTASGFFGEDVPVSAHFSIGSPGDADESSMTSYAGVNLKELRMLAPRTVVRKVPGTGATVTSSVSWDWSSLTDAAIAQPGTVTLSAAPETGFAARLVVTLLAAERVNVLRQSGVHPDFTFKDSTAFALTDGNRNVSGFADWRSGGATNRVNPNRVWFSFDQPRQITGINVYDIGGKQNVGTVTAQYRTVLGGWKNLPTAAGWPYVNQAADLSLEASFTPVLATGVRVIIGNKSSSTWMTLSEIEVYGPRTPAS